MSRLPTFPRSARLWCVVRGAYGVVYGACMEEEKVHGAWCVWCIVRAWMRRRCIVRVWSVVCGAWCVWPGVWRVHGGGEGAWCVVRMASGECMVRMLYGACMDEEKVHGA